MCVLFGDFFLLLGTECLKLGEGRGDQDLQQSLNDMQRSKLWIYHAPRDKGCEDSPRNKELKKLRQGFLRFTFNLHWLNVSFVKDSMLIPLTILFLHYLKPRYTSKGAMCQLARSREN